MNNPKLLEAIKELEMQKAAIEAALPQLRMTFGALNPGLNPDEIFIVPDIGEPETLPKARRKAGGSYVDESVDAIMKAGKALHINLILDYIQSHRGTRPSRASVESSLIGEMKASGKQNRQSRIIKTAPSTFGVPRSLAMAS